MPTHLRKFWSKGACMALYLGLSVPALAQAPIPDAAIAQELQRLAAHAGIIFVGQIVNIHPQKGLVEITFQVEQVISGSVGSSYTFREWSGLWPSGQHRYSVGQRVLAFMHTVSKVGMSSPVHGAEGLVPVIVQGADSPELLDIRRVAASVIREPNSPLPTESNGAVLLSEAVRTFKSPLQGPAQTLPRESIPLRAHPPAALRPARMLPSGTAAQAHSNSSASLISLPGRSHVSR